MMIDRLKVADVSLVAGLISSPAWVQPLESVNVFLTTLTLTAGLILGLVRMWFQLKKLLREKDGGDDA